MLLSPIGEYAPNFTILGKGFKLTKGRNIVLGGQLCLIDSHVNQDWLSDVQ